MTELQKRRDDQPRSRPFFWWALGVVFLAFFLANHDVTVSTAEAFTGSVDEMEEQAVGGNLLRRIAFLAIAGLGLIGLMTSVQREDLKTPQTGFGLLGVLMFAFFGWCLLSLFWSDDPTMTLRRVVVLGCLLTGALGIVRQLSLRELLHLAWIVPAAGLAVGFGAELALGTFRPWSAGYRFSGTLHPNSQGLSLAAMCFATFCLARDAGRREDRRAYRGRYWSLFAVGLLFLVLTKSRTSFAGVMLAVTLLATLRTASGWKWSVGLASLWTVSTAALCIMLFDVDVERQLTGLALLGRTEQAGSLTGRLPIWETLLEFVRQRPLVGYGYGSFWTPDRIDTVSSELQWGVREAHSAYLDTVLGVGLVGGMLLLLTIFTGLWKACEQYLRTGHPLFGFVFAMLVFGLINGCTESGMTMPMIVPFLVVCGLLQTATVAVLVPNAGEHTAALVTSPLAKPFGARSQHPMN